MFFFLITWALFTLNYWTKTSNEITLLLWRAERAVAELDHPLYSPDLAPCDFWLFPEMKTAMKGRRFFNVSDIQRQVAGRLENIPKNEFLWVHFVNFIVRPRIVPEITFSPINKLQRGFKTSAFVQSGNYLFSNITNGFPRYLLLLKVWTPLFSVRLS